jgi:hypothetical protein
MSSSSFKISELFESIPELSSYCSDDDMFDRADNGARFSREYDERNEACPLKMPKLLCNETFSHKIKKPSSHENTPSEIAFIAQLRRGTPQIETARTIAKERLASRPVLMYADGHQDTHIFKGAIRGDAAYTRRVRERIDSACKRLDELPGTLLFFTGTVAYKQLHGGLYAAYEVARRALTRWLKRVRRRAHIEYVAVLEAQASGNPHWHVLFKFVGEDFDTRKNEQGRYIILNRGVGPTIRKWWSAGLATVYAVRDCGAFYYIKKYLAKSIQDVLARADPKTDDERLTLQKELFGLVGPIVTQVRSLRVSKGLRVCAVPCADARPAADDELRAAVEEYKAKPKEKAALDYLLTKLTCNCAAKLWLIHTQAGRDFFADYENVYTKSISDEEIFFRKNAVPLGCAGCILTEIISSSIDAAKQHFSDLRAGRIALDPGYYPPLAEQIQFFRDLPPDL